MQDERKYLEELFQKYQQGQVTEKEKEIIARWLTQLDVNETNLAEDDLHYKQLLSKEALKDHFFPKAASDPKIINFSFWIRSAAAMLLIGAGAFFYLQRKPKQVITQRTAKNELLPGSNKAILTLSNGSSINLNAAKNGILAQQGATLINKSARGQIVYAHVAKGIPTDSILFNTISTPNGGQYQVTLQDGTRVWLNAASSIRFPTTFSGSQRNVEISGEVYFEVAKNKKMPFHVILDHMQIQVLGTHFNVMAYNNEPNIKTTLLEGSVKITTENATAFLVPGQQATVPVEHNVIYVNNNPDAEDAAAWKDGYFIFKNENIQSIMKKISRWYDVDISYEGKITDIGFNGAVSRSKNASEVFKILELTKAVSFKTDGKKVIVMPGSYKTRSQNI